MKILIITHFFPPYNSIASLRPYSWAKYWTLAGHDVTILTTTKNTPQVNDFNLPNPGYNVVEVPLPSIFDAFRRQIIRLGKAQKNSNLKSTCTNTQETIARKLYQRFNLFRFKTGVLSSFRMPDVNDLWIWPAIKKAQTLDHWDLVISTFAPYATHVVAHKLKQRGYAKLWIADYRDLWTKSPVYPGIWPFTIIEKAIEKKLLMKADMLTTVSDPLVLFLKDKFKSKEVIKIPNGYDKEEIIQLSPEPFFPCDDLIRIVYTGSIYNSNRDPTPLFKAIQKLKDEMKMASLLKNLKVIFVGPQSQFLLNKIEYFNLKDTVEWRGFLNREDTLRMQRDANILLFLSWAKPERGVITGKLYEYLNSKTPILSVGGHPLDDADKLIQTFNAGWVCNRDISAIQRILVDALTTKKTNNKNALNQEMLNQFDRKFLAEKLLEAAETSLSLRT